MESLFVREKFILIVYRKVCFDIPYFEHIMLYGQAGEQSMGNSVKLDPLNSRSFNKNFQAAYLLCTSQEARGRTGSPQTVEKRGSPPQKPPSGEYDTQRRKQFILKHSVTNGAQDKERVFLESYTQVRGEEIENPGWEGTLAVVIKLDERLSNTG